MLISDELEILWEILESGARLVGHVKYQGQVLEHPTAHLAAIPGIGGCLLSIVPPANCSWMMQTQVLVGAEQQIMLITGGLWLMYLTSWLVEQAEHPEQEEKPWSLADVLREAEDFLRAQDKGPHTQDEGEE